ncbi:FtsQ-type POTRA domain-containing protein [Lentisphaerota bacterium WC36G]|nr:FtsQ-type POTRA domain-containing protein [Lentisphaerae bacterium WC36]
MAKPVEPKKLKKVEKKTKKTRSKSSKTVKNKKNASPAIRAFLFLLTILFVLGIILWGVYYSAQKMLWKNPHFVVAEVNVSSDNGWWDNRKATVCRYLGITLKKSNIFELKLDKLRAKLLKQANILDVTIIRTLPDKLDITIIERIPRAQLKTPKNNLVIDEDCMVIRKGIVNDQVINGLPRILIPYDLAKKLNNGELRPEFEYAIKLIMLTKTDYPFYRIHDISIIDPRKLSFYCEYGNKRYQIHMPVKNIATNLESLSNKIDSLLRQNIKFRTIDLTNRDPIVR